MICYVRLLFLFSSTSCCCLQGECVVLRDRKLNIAPAIKKQVNFNSIGIAFLFSIFTIFFLLISSMPNNNRPLLRQMAPSIMHQPNQLNSTIFRSISFQLLLQLECIRRLQFQHYTRKPYHTNHIINITVYQW